MSNTQAPEVVQADPNETGVYEIESLCMNCRDDGMTRILPIKIPYFKDILLESFSCDHCGWKNNTVKSAGQIQEKGSKYTFKLDKLGDFQRQVVRSDTGIFRLEDIDLEMPPAPGQFTNLEGIISKIKTDLELDQPQRKESTPELYTALESIIEKIGKMLAGDAFPVTVSLDDISGNSFIEPSPEDKGSKYSRNDYLRSHAQNAQLGLVADDDVEESNGVGLEGVDIVDNEVYELQTECPACSKPCTVNMKKTNIPHFKEVILMATVCDHCGYRTSDVKTGGAVPEKGQRITLEIRTIEDMSRDILKSESCVLKSHDLGLEVQPGTLGGRFTTVEGLLTQVRDQLRGQIFDVGDADLAQGDSMSSETKERWDKFFDRLDRAIKAEFTYTVILEDPLANSFVQRNVDSGEDPQIKIEEYERTEEEIDDLGLKEMKTEGYENDDAE
ncbi:nucleolar zinc-finger protein [Elasticomyces elasticus]|uniref:Nucleolar zinc-finger protein n=1 Tax=Exophiala sideris TaxID=1016849 RepID=A0ABR0JIN3_9EURO|nr:nucleolar zinc-finger protein [Elasticomyces elasticus]KAK5033462.1 nucleolar zinc-finger protein [Exophiala sideris]KAK5042043.1 nucleolar zinc-finger protein [Exophiala sideris]KAK5064006.1 nucleolar zinc-finger protein [Exophiala sideris]KAK5185311.1 nucleolar zinc-finger protein [Eurotiomycetes sp. CCFEE 6388]